MPAEPNSCVQVSDDYFTPRGLRRNAGVASLWARGVGAVISGHYSGWNLGLLAGGWGGFALVRRNRLVLAPEEAFAIEAQAGDGAAAADVRRSVARA